MSGNGGDAVIGFYTNSMLLEFIFGLGLCALWRAGRLTLPPAVAVLMAIAGFAGLAAAGENAERTAGALARRGLGRSRGCGRLRRPRSRSGWLRPLRPGAAGRRLLFHLSVALVRHGVHVGGPSDEGGNSGNGVLVGPCVHRGRHGPVHGAGICRLSSHRGAADFHVQAEDLPAGDQVGAARRVLPRKPHCPGLKAGTNGNPHGFDPLRELARVATAWPGFSFDSICRFRPGRAQFRAESLLRTRHRVGRFRHGYEKGKTK